MTNQPMFNRPAARQGFTLIELLVVIAIVAVLALITLMLASRIRDKSKQVKAINTINHAANMPFEVGHP